MKTLLLSQIFPPTHGGSGRWFWELYSRLPREEYVVVTDTIADTEAFDQQAPVNIHRLPLSSSDWGLKSKTGLTFYLKTIWLLRKLIKQQHIETLHCGRCLPEGFMGYLLKLITGIPYLCFVHGEDIETARTSRELSWIVNKSLSGAQLLICNSQNTADLLSQHWQVPKDKLKVLNPGVDTAQFNVIQPNPKLRSTLGWEDKTVLLTVGRLQKRKGQDMMIQALPELLKTIPNLLYCVVGQGGELENLKALVTELKLEKSVQLIPDANDETLAQCYQQCDCFILPNRAVGNDIEGFGMVLAEAQACGKPVIAGNSGGTKEAIQPNVSGLIVECTDPQKLADALVPLLSNPQKMQAMGAAGRHFVETELDWAIHLIKAKSIFAMLTK